MPEPLTQQDVKSKTDPSVAKQWDDEVPLDLKFKDMYAIADKIKVGLLITQRQGLGPVSRSMAVARRDGPDFLFIANAHSNKFRDLENSKDISIGFNDSKTYDWISVTGTATVTGNDDPRVAEVFSKPAGAWFGDLGDGVHDGTAKDPRVRLIEVKSKYITYYKTEVGSIGYFKEIATATVTGQVAVTGKLRQMEAQDIEQARKWEGSKGL